MLEVDWHNGSDSEQVPELLCYLHRFGRGLKNKQLGLGGAKYAENQRSWKFKVQCKLLPLKLSRVIAIESWFLKRKGTGKPTEVSSWYRFGWYEASGNFPLLKHGLVCRKYVAHVCKIVSMPLNTHRNTLEPRHLSLDQVREEKGPLSCLQWQWCFTAFTSKRKETGEVLKYQIQESCLNTLNLNLQTQHFWLPVLPSQKKNNEINILPLPPFNQVPNILSFKSCP